MTKKPPRKSKKAKNLAGLKKNAYRAHTRGYVDSVGESWVEKLSDKDKKWYNKFLREFYGTTFSSSKMLHPGGKAKRRELYREKNKREADITYKYNKVKNIESTDTLLDGLNSTSSPEELYISLIDLKKSISNESADPDNFFTSEEIERILKDDE